ncbi:hypothetical protein [Paenibacillus sp. LK1]|uniref:hypothetical protein n=1 Tax=Paenibacillus sp. LK1 TaxID=2053014 RepID=UPI0015D48213|nr:hypothetical protein [Paenibacillus sp. LK1]
MAKREDKEAVILGLINLLRENGVMSFEIADRIHDMYYDGYISAKYADHLAMLTQDEF